MTLALLWALCLSPAFAALTPAPVFAAETEAKGPKEAKETKEVKTSGPKPAKLSEVEKADIARIEKYLNELKSVSARFLQINDMGNMRNGMIDIQRPGKMRVTYDAPDKDMIVADGNFVHMWDDEMGQQTSVPVGSSIAEFVLRENIKLSGDVVVTRFARYPAKLEVSLVSVKEPDQGELTLVFEDKPLKLRQWKVLDPQGRTTGVSLENAREGVSFDDGTFNFVSPKFGKGKS